MTEGQPRPGKHAARHRAPNALERSRNRAVDSAAAVRDVSLPRVAHGGRIVAVGAAGGALAVTALVGAQVADQSVASVARASADAGSATDGPASAAPSNQPTDGAARDARTTVSRSAARPSLNDLKKKSVADEDGDTHKSSERVITKKAEVDVSDPQALAQEMLSDYGWGQDEFSCLDDLWIGESNWKVDAENPTSSAYGIPQALPGSKMASAGSDWQTNAATQIEWGLGYIQAQYGSPCAAQSFKSSHNWY